MSSSHVPFGESVAARQESTPANGAPSEPAAADAHEDWLERMQRSRARHAAITKNLYTWSNYKSWADRVKSAWDKEPSK